MGASRDRAIPPPRNYNVAPRYTPGSPALVDYQTAQGVAEDERRAYERALSGRYGDAERVNAQALGLSGIVERRTVYAHHYVALDVLTGETRDSRGVKVSSEAKARDAELWTAADAQRFRARHFTQLLSALKELVAAASAREFEHVVNKPTVSGLNRFSLACARARSTIEVAENK